MNGAWLERTISCTFGRHAFCSLLLSCSCRCHSWELHAELERLGA